MTITITGCGLAFAAWLVHVAIWRVRPPKGSAKALVLLFCSLIPFFLGLLYLIGIGWIGLATVLPATLSDALLAGCLALTLASAYVLTYPAIEVESPSVLIVEAIAGAGPDGLPEDKVRSAAGDKDLLQPRLDDLVREQYAVAENGVYRLTDKGRTMARSFLWWRGVLGAREGG